MMDKWESVERISVHEGGWLVVVVMDGERGQSESGAEAELEKYVTWSTIHCWMLYFPNVSLLFYPVVSTIVLS